MAQSDKPTILMIDDSEMYTLFLCKALENEYICETAHDGMTGIKKACTDSPELILLDIVMPEMDGYKVCSLLKKNQATKNIPVIFMTSMDAAADETKGLKLGAVDYITKPFHMPIVRARIENHLKTQRLLTQLRAALEDVETLKGLLPICSYCKKIRDDQGYWQEVEEYISNISEVTFSHGICPACQDTFFKKKG